MVDKSTIAIAQLIYQPITFAKYNKVEKVLKMSRFFIELGFAQLNNGATEI